MSEVGCVVQPPPPQLQEKSFIFRLNDGQGPELLRQVFLERGWVEFEEDENEEWDWNLWWRTSRFRNCDYESVYPWQRLNHYPKSTAITKKDSLARNLKRMKGVYGSAAYNFSPTAFNLPNDYTKFVNQYSKAKDKTLYWICKPADLSRGRGIFVFRDLSELQYDCNAVVQEYIPNPMLISGYKFDLRVYVLVTSFQPLQIYIYEEGLVRFSTEKFDLGALGNMFAHLTNTSINKHSPAYSMDKERVGPGCKWTLAQLRHYLRSTLNIDDTLLFGRIINIVILTLLIQSSQVPKAANCFELYGFDILVDDNQKPWLLEVNFSPALNSDCAVDLAVKKPMLHDLTDMLGYSDKDMHRGGPGPGSHSSIRGHSGCSAKTSVSKSHQQRGGGGHRPPTRLPDLQRVKKAGRTSSEASLGPSSSTTSTLSWQESIDGFGEGEDVVPIIPGCGLPSVQQPPSKDDGSGRASPVDFPQQYPRIPAIRPNSQSGVQRAPSRGKPPRPKSKLGKPGQTKIKPAGLDGAGSTRDKKKRDSKSSDYSDSGISSFSGSSDGPDSLSDESKSKLESNVAWTKSNNGDSVGLGKSGSAKALHLQNRSSSGHSSPHQQRRKSLAHLTPTKHTSQLDMNGNTVKSMDNISVSSSPSSKGHHLSHIAFTNTSKPAILHSASKGSNQSSALSHSRSQTQQRLYSRPWRGKVGPSESSPLIPNNPKQLAKQVGSFYLVFPFNEVTRKCASSPDPRVVIKECVKQLKDRVDKKGHDVLWGPITDSDGGIGALP